MKKITLEMMKLFNMKELGFDFMGYHFDNKEQLSYHHLIIPKRNHGPETIENGAILTQSPVVSAHDYLHAIEHVDYEIFLLITSEIIDENIKGKIDKENLIKIRDLLLNFEKEHCGDTTKKGKPLIRSSFVENRIRL